MHVGFLWESWRERGHLKDLGVARRLVLKWIYVK